MGRKAEDLTGQRFGSLTAVELTETHTPDGRHRYWRCVCDCGATHLITAGDLKRRVASYCPACASAKLSHDLSGQRFGRLVALDAMPRDPSKTSRCKRWRCVCDCGRETIVPTESLMNGNTRSCGCMQREAVKAFYVAGTAPNKLTDTGKLRATNSSGYTGVHWDKARKLWAAEITFKRKRYHLGRYADIKDAAESYRRAKARIHGEFLDWYKNEYLPGVSAGDGGDENGKRGQ